MKKILSYIVIFTLFIIAAVGSTAIESRYKNNLLNVELSQTPDNRVSVLLVFEKPYTEPVKVIYKTDNEYNILLPETYHSITSVNTINALNIRSANVKLVPYFNQDNANGYTKISIKTTRPVVFNAHASYITTKIADTELIDKLQQDNDFKIAPTTLPTESVKKASVTPQVKPVPKKITQSTSAAKKTQTKTAKKATPQKQTTQKVAVKPVTKPVAKQVPQTQPVKQVIQEKQTPQPTQVATTIPAQTEDTKLAIDTENSNVTEQITAENMVTPQLQQTQSEIKEKENVGITSESFRFGENIHLVFLAGAAFLLLILLIRLLGSSAKRQIRTIPDTKYANHPITEEKYSADIPQEIQNLSWQEKYKFMKQKEDSQFEFNPTSQEQTADIPNFADTIAEIEEESAETNSSPTEMESIEVYQSESIQDKTDIPSEELVDEAFLELISEEPKKADNDPFGLNAEPINEGFEPAQPKANTTSRINNLSRPQKPLHANNTPAPTSNNIRKETNKTATNPSKNLNVNPAEPTLINQAKISKTKGFYLIRYGEEVALMGYIKDQIFLINTFNTNQSFVQTRLTEKQHGADIYLVRSDDYKALVKVSKDDMKTLIRL